MGDVYDDGLDIKEVENILMHVWESGASSEYCHEVKGALSAQLGLQKWIKRWTWNGNLQGCSRRKWNCRVWRK